MKRVLINLLTISSLSLLMFASCKKNDVMVKTNGGTAGTLTASSTNIVLDKSKYNDDSTSVITFSFTAPKYNFSAAATNTIQIDSVGDNWQNPKLVALTTNELSYSYTNPDFEKLMLQIIPFGVSSQVNVRVQHSLSSSVAIYSNVVTLNVTPYSLSQTIYVAGAYEGWAVPSANLDSLISPTGNGVYTGLVNFPAGTGNQDFKILLDKKDYNGNYGAGTTPGTIVQNTQTNITAPAALYYQVTVDLNKSTISYINTWSLIGDASPGGWSTDTDMSYDATTKTWFTTVILVGDGSKAIKFRYLHDWGVNLGGSGGTLSLNGANIVIPTGTATYKVTLDPVADTYTLVKQ